MDNENLNNKSYLVETKAYKYVAFISYRHVQPDYDIAKKIHEEIENFKVPNELDPEGKYRELRVFRDREELTTKDLSSSINEALIESEYLIIVCSHRTKESIWCTREVYEFRKYHPDDHIIPVIVEGEPNEVFNEAMQNLKSKMIGEDGSIIEKDLELLAADLRPDTVKKHEFPGYCRLEKDSLPELEKYKKSSYKILKESEIYRIMATVLNVSFGDLKQRQKERRLRRIILSVAVISIVLLAFGIAMTNLYFKSVASERKALQQTSMLTLKSADQKVSEGDRTLGLLIANHAMTNIDEDMDDYEKLNANFIRILNDALVIPNYSTIQKIDLSTTTLFYTFSENLGYIVVPGNLNELNIYNIKNGELLKSLGMSGSVSAVAAAQDDTLIYVACRDGKLYELDLNTFELELLYESDTAFVTQILTESSKYIFIVETASTVRIFDLSKREVVETISFDFSVYLRYMKMLDEDSYLTVNSLNEISIHNFNNDKIEILREGEGKDSNLNYMYMALSKDKELLVYTDRDEDKSPFLNVYRLSNGESFQITDSVGYITALSISKDGKTVYALDNTNNGAVQSWDLETGDFLDSYAYGLNPAIFVLNKDETKLVLATADNNEIIVIEDITSDDYEEDRRLSLGSQSLGEVVNIKFVKNDEYILSLSDDGSLRVIKVNNPLQEKALKGQIIASSRDTQHLLIYYPKTKDIKIYNFQSQNEEILGIMSNDYIKGIQTSAISNSGKYIALSNSHGLFAEILGRDGMLLAKTKEHDRLNTFSVVAKIEFSKDEDYVYTMNELGQVYVSDLMTGELIREIKDKEAPSVSFKLSEDDSIIAIRYLDGTTSLIKTENGELIQQIKGDVYLIEGDKGVIKRIIGQEGDKLFSEDQSGRNYYASNNERLSKQDRNYAVSEYTSKDGRYLLTTITGNDTIVTDLETGNRLRTLPMGNDSWASTSMITADNRYIAYEFDEENIIISKFYTKNELLEMSKDMLAGRKLSHDEMIEEGFLEGKIDEK